MGSVSLDPRLQPPKAEAPTAVDNSASPEPTPAIEPERDQAAVAVDIPYAFAKANGVVPIQSEDGEPTIALRDGSDPAVLIEVRRHLGQPFRIRKVNPSEFDRHLHSRYAVDESAVGLTVQSTAMTSSTPLRAAFRPPRICSTARTMRPRSG